MIVLIDNYDSFTYNLYHYLGELGAHVTVHRNDKVSVGQVLSSKPRAIVLSPGPKTPADAGICLELIERAAGQVPVFGVCLGMQAIGQVFGGQVVRAPKMMHGKVSVVSHKGDRLFQGIPPEFRATRYHSLLVDRASLPISLEVTAEADGLIMGVRHKEYAIQGVQFHPESIASEHGHTMLRNFLEMSGAD